MNSRLLTLALLLAASAVACKDRKTEKSEPTARAPAETSTDGEDERPEDLDETPELPVEPDLEQLETGVPECDNLVTLIVGCDKMPEELRAEWIRRAGEWKTSLRSASEPTRRNTIALCNKLLPKIEEARASIGCE